MEGNGSGRGGRGGGQRVRPLQLTVQFGTSVSESYSLSPFTFVPTGHLRGAARGKLLLQGK